MHSCSQLPRFSGPEKRKQPTQSRRARGAHESMPLSAFALNQMEANNPIFTDTALQNPVKP